MAKHIESLHIEKYRGINNLHLDNLGAVNIFLGDNNTGKTSVLEAIQLLCSSTEYDLIQIARQREKYRVSFRMGLSILDAFLFMFDASSANKEENNYYLCVEGMILNQIGKVTIKGRVTERLFDLKELSKYNPTTRHKTSDSFGKVQEEARTFIGTMENTLDSIRLTTDFEINNYIRIIKDSDKVGALRINLVQTIDHIIENAFNKLIKSKERKEKAVELLKKFDNTISDIRYINDDNRFVPVIENINGDYIPLSLYGDGMKKALTMLNAIINTENGAVLIDEFETALHTSVMNKVFKFILDAANKLNVQLFLTTHSIEAVDKLLESADSRIDALRVIRLKKKGSLTTAKITNGKDALEDRKEYNLELRV